MVSRFQVRKGMPRDESGSRDHKPCRHHEVSRNDRDEVAGAEGLDASEHRSCRDRIRRTVDESPGVEWGQTGCVGLLGRGP